MSKFNKEFLKIEADYENGLFWICLNDQKKHSVTRYTLERIHEESDTGAWNYNEQYGKDIGLKLFQILNGEDLLTSIRRNHWDSGKQTTLVLDLPGKFGNIPFEIMSDGSSFLALEEAFPMARQVTTRNAELDIPPENRPISMLFMACAPEDSLPELFFEAEEDAITKQIEDAGLPLDLMVEDSGSLDGLEKMLRELKGVDVIHLSGHAMFSVNGPVFFMESEIGASVRVTPDLLWDAFGKHIPKLLFLSGCKTGRVTHLAIESFAHEMVKLGIPTVLGWGFTVGNLGANRFTKSFYKSVGKGFSIDRAVSRARQEIRDLYSTWSQLRMFCDASPSRVLTDPDVTVVARSKRKLRYRFVKDSPIKVLDYGFVGRRRQMQLGLRILKGYVADKNGLLITGTAGVGKSSLAGKLIDRFPQKKVLVFVGEVQEGEILEKLVSLFEEIGLDAAKCLLNLNEPFEQRIKALFRGPFKEVETLIVFDDFERNLELVQDTYQILPSARATLQPFLEGLPWSEGKTQLLITCRYPFTLEKSGADLVAQQLGHIPLMCLEGADLRKKMRNLANIKESPHLSVFEKYSGGNPRLLERFETLTEQKIVPNIGVLEDALINERDSFVEKYLIHLLVKAQGNAMETFLANASVYQTPVTADAFEEIGSRTMLEKAVSLTLVEKEGVLNPHYWVLPIIREQFWEKVKDPRAAHEFAYRWYDKKVNQSERFHYTYVSECLRHGMAAFKMKGCWHHAAKLSEYFRNVCLLSEGISQLSPLLRYFSKTDARRALKLGVNDAGSVTFLNNFAYLQYSLGKLSEAKNYFKETLSILRNGAEKGSPAIGTLLHNIGSIELTYGKFRSAKSYFNKALIIFRKNFGEMHSDTARTLNNLGYLLQRSGKFASAKIHYENSLSIYMELFGENHPETAQCINNIGFLLSSTGQPESALPYFEKALTLRLQILGESHPDTAQSLNNLGSVHHLMGNLPIVRSYYERAYKINEETLGEKHSETVIGAWNLLTLSLMLEDDTSARKWFSSLVWLIDCKTKDLPEKTKSVQQHLLEFVAWHKKNSARRQSHED